MKIQLSQKLKIKSKIDLIVLIFPKEIRPYSLISLDNFRKNLIFLLILMEVKIVLETV